MTVAELQGRMSSRELSEWIAFDRIAGEDRRARELEAKAEQGLRGVRSGRRR